VGGVERAAQRLAVDGDVRQAGGRAEGGDPTAEAALEGGAPLATTFAPLKFIATTFSTISGIPGGIFAPSLAVGAGLGANIAHFFPTAPIEPIILLGMVSYFAGVVQAPITAFVIVTEMTDNHAMVIPLMADVGDKLDDVGALSALGELAERHQDARGMLQLGKAALARGLPLDYYAFPTAGVPRYSPVGPAIESALLFAIVRQESAFNPADLSSANAMGLMQVTPIAARDTCKRFSCTYDMKRLKNDTAYNLQVGAAEFAGLMQDYRGNYILAVAAYNAGRGRVREWIERFGDPRDPKVDPVDWVERIPFMETRNYVQRVMENLQVYRTLFGGNAPLTIETDLRHSVATN